MNIFAKSLIISLVIFFIHSIILSVLTIVYFDTFGYYGLWGGIIYFFIYGYWAYYLSIFMYLGISNKLSHKGQKYSLALGICLLGYLVYRTGDIIDNDFIHNFKLLPLILFIFTAWMIVLLERNIGKTNQTKIAGN